MNDEEVELVVNGRRVQNRTVLGIVKWLTIIPAVGIAVGIPILMVSAVIGILLMSVLIVLLAPLDWILKACGRRGLYTVDNYQRLRFVLSRNSFRRKA